jgi:hypothetical protein
VGPSSHEARVRFEALARLLMPARRPSDGLPLETDQNWIFNRSTTAGADAVVWGRPPLASGTPGPELARVALARERALSALRSSPPEPLHVVDWHRWHPSSIRPGTVRNRLRQALLGGLLVELTASGGERIPRVLDEVARAAGASGRVATFRPGSGGSALVHLIGAKGQRYVLRAGLAGIPGDPGHSSDALRLLERAEVPSVPRLAGSGEVAGASWTSESMLIGVRPRRITRRLIEDLAGFCARLPASGGPVSAPQSDAALVASALPEYAPLVTDVSVGIAEALEGLPGLMRHGDFWSGNVITARGELTGVIDWDAWHPAAAPGTDLLHFLVAEQAIRRRQGLGEVWCCRPWSSEEFTAAAAPYWRALGLSPTAKQLEATGITWWMGQVANNLGRLPHLANDGRWLARNVTPVLEALSG